MNELREDLGFAGDGAGQGVDDAGLALDAGRYIGSYRREGLASLPAAEAARYLLLELGHAHVPLGLVVGEGDRAVLEEGQYPVLVLLEPVEQVDDLGPGRSTSLAGLPGRGLEWIAPKAFGHMLSVEPSALPEAAAFGLGAGFEQKLPELPGPGLSEVLEVGQLPDDVGVADRVIALQAEIGLPEVVDQRVGEALQDAHALDGLAAALGVYMVERVALGGEAVQPRVAASDAHPGLVGVQDRLALEAPFERLDEFAKVAAAALSGRGDGSLAHRAAEQVLAHAADPP